MYVSISLSIVLLSSRQAAFTTRTNFSLLYLRQEERHFKTMTTTTSLQKSAFVLGAGFIGTCVIEELPKANYQVIALVRRQAHVNQLKAIGVSPVIGTLEDEDLITTQSSVSDVVIHTATVDHLPSAEAILRGV
jgi:D-arabinose 1-dehydrogenase-like Zn-dependent alcohol dehydrogenase